MVIEDRVFFAESLMIPSSYQTIFKRINHNLFQKQYAVISNSYRVKLNAVYHNDVPILKEYSTFSQNNFLRNVIFLKQAHNFEKLAKNAIPEVKPLLLYYAENQLQAFFINSLFSFKDSSKNHGLTLSGNTYENIGIKLAKNGFFPRIVNVYTILNAGWFFSPLESTTSNSFQERNDHLIFLNEPTIKLKELINLKNQMKPNPNGYILDLLDYMFLFIASFLARYKPDLWHEIIAGEKGDEFAYFKQSFNRFGLVWNRLIHALFSIYRNSIPPSLYSMDMEMENFNYQIQT